MITLDPPRQRILDADGHVLVTGGPGSGKTTIALLKASQRIEAGLRPGEVVLFLSFSRAAVARIAQASQIQIPRALRSQLSIQTFHSFFWEILRAHGYLLGAPKNIRLLPPHDEAALRTAIEEEGGDEAWNNERERLFREEGLAVFDLFAPKAYLLLRRCRRLRTLLSSRHPLIIVDEAQDTAESQWRSVELLAEQSQIVCLADLEQQIYDFLPDVSAQRVVEIMTALTPLRIDLAGQNHRSADTQILAFGNDILLGTPRGAPYRGVSHWTFSPRQRERDGRIRSSVGFVATAVREATGRNPENIGLLATWGRGVAIISRALTGTQPSEMLAHRVACDEARVFLSSRLIAFLLEPRRQEAQELTDLGDGLDLAAAAYRARGGTTNRGQAQRFSDGARNARQGERPRANAVGAKLLDVLRALRTHQFRGDPREDWIECRHRLRDCGAAPLRRIALDAEQLIAFQRGQRLASGLLDLWHTKGTYARARVAFDVALAQDQLLAGGEDLRGIHVMTIHKAKGKEFDAVVIVDDANNCPLLSPRDAAPFTRSRRLARVGITRARHHLLMLMDRYTRCPLLNGHRL